MSAPGRLDRARINAAVAALVQTVEESPEGAPVGLMYAAALGYMDFQTFGAVVSLCERSDLLTVDGSNVARITDKGRDVAGRIRQSINSKEAQQ